jgi:methylenetetrahydrofolate reductase (NADPH)
MIQLADAIAAGPFPIVVELVASGVKREAQLLEIASNLANIPEVVAGSIASYADGKVGQDPVRVGCAVRARGLMPNIHLTCVNKDRVAMRQTLRELRALQLFSVVALTGDRPAHTDSAGRVQGDPAYASPSERRSHEEPAHVSSELDSVQLTEMVAHLRTTEGTPFFISVAVSPFLYERDTALAQYRRLEQKVAAGANLAITKPGWDARKFAELKRYVDERGLKLPLLGNVHVLTRRAAEQLATTTVPGARISSALLDTIRKETDGADGGTKASLERAARTLALLRGLGYAGAYITGTHAADHVSQILHRADELKSNWQRCADDLQFGEPDGFYLDAAAGTASGAAGATRVQPAKSQS